MSNKPFFLLLSIFVSQVKYLIPQWLKALIKVKKNVQFNWKKTKPCICGFSGVVSLLKELPTNYCIHKKHYQYVISLWTCIHEVQFVGTVSFHFLCTGILEHPRVKDSHLQNKWKRAHRILYINSKRTATRLNTITDKPEPLLETTVKMPGDTEHQCQVQTCIKLES